MQRTALVWWKGGLLELIGDKGGGGAGAEGIKAVGGEIKGPSGVSVPASEA